MGRPKSTEIIGNTYSFLKVIGRSEVISRKYRCICVCGKEFDTTKQRLENGRAKSCGCKNQNYFQKLLLNTVILVKIKIHQHIKVILQWCRDVATPREQVMKSTAVLVFL
jgi:hypothetical protein